MKNFFLSVLKALFLVYLFVAAGAFIPRIAKSPFPEMWGRFEGKFNRDMTGWWFTSWQGEGSCRLENSIEAFRRPGSIIMLGVISPPGKKPYPHLWVADNGLVIDGSCNPSKPGCQDRKAFAMVDSGTLKVIWQAPRDEPEKRLIGWGIGYLKGVKSVLSTKQ